MRPWIAVLTLATAATMVQAAPAVRTRTYFLTGVKDDADVNAITQAVRQLPSVTEVSGLTPRGKTLVVRYDTHVISHGQVAYAIMATHASPDRNYGATMRFAVPQYATGGHTSEIDAIIAKQAKVATIKPLDREKGVFSVKLLPFAVDPAKKGPQGFQFGDLLHPIHDPAPKGLGMEFQFLGMDNKPDPLE